MLIKLLILCVFLQNLNILKKIKKVNKKLLSKSNTKFNDKLTMSKLNY